MHYVGCLMMGAVREEKNFPFSSKLYKRGNWYTTKPKETKSGAKQSIQVLRVFVLCLA